MVTENNLEQLKVIKLLNLEETMAKTIFEGAIFPWEVLPKIGDFIINLGKQLDKQNFKEIKENVWVANSATIAPTVCIEGPCIIDENANVKHSAYIRKNVIIGKNAVVGNSTELKNVILFNNVQVPHYNYVGDSILGYKAHMGAGSIASNLRSDKANVTIRFKNQKLETNLRKFGAILADNTEIGCGCVLNPGCIIGKNTIIYPLSSVKGYVNENSIYKNQNEIAGK